MNNGGNGNGGRKGEGGEMMESSIRIQRFSADTTLEELDEFEDLDGMAVSTPENTQSEFDRLLKRYVHLDTNARNASKKRFAKRIW